MILDDYAVLMGLRSRLRSVVVSSTGVLPLEATENGFRRTTGSFAEDGFVAGMEVVPAGFTDNTPAIVRAVTATELLIEDTRPAEAEAPGRSLTVGIPAVQSWENVKVDRPVGRWYIDEDYLPGPNTRITVTQHGEFEHAPTYVLRLGGLAGKSVAALYKVAKGILEAFPPNGSIVLSNGQVIRVRSEPAPYRGQVLPSGEEGYVEIVITIPLWARTQKSIS